MSDFMVPYVTELPDSVDRRGLTDQPGLQMLKVFAGLLTKFQIRFHPNCSISKSRAFVLEFDDLSLFSYFL